MTIGYAADLDTREPAWGVHEDNVDPDSDLVYDDYDDGIGGQGDFAIVSGPAKYETCRYTTNYKDNVEKNDLENGIKACVRTSDNRHAFVVVKKVTREEIQAEVVVWDPPFEE